MQNLLHFRSLVEKHHSMRLVGAQKVDIFPNMMLSPLLAIYSEQTYTHHLRVSRMMIRHKDVFIRFLRVSKGIVVENIPYITYVNNSFISVQVDEGTIYRCLVGFRFSKQTERLLLFMKKSFSATVEIPSTKFLINTRTKSMICLTS